MSKFTRLQVAQMMKEKGLVPVYYNNSVDQALSIAEAVYRGGGRVLEFTNRGDLAHEVFTGLIKQLRKKLPEMALGIGSIVDGATAALYLQLGADFVVSASLREDVAKICNRRKVLYAPGCGSLTEIGKAEELGCEIVKLFPGGVYGPGFVKAVRGPQPWTSIMPTGGVDITAESLTTWFEAGVTCVGIGSKLITKAIVADEDYALLQSRVRDVIQRIAKIRGEN